MRLITGRPPERGWPRVSLALAAVALEACIPAELTLAAGDGDATVDVAAVDGALDGPPDVGEFDAPAHCLASLGVECVAEAPEGWMGPFALYNGSTVDAPKCPSSFPVLLVDGHEGLTANAPTCTTCACGPPGPESCTGATTLAMYSDIACTNPCTVTPNTLPAACSYSTPTSVSCPFGIPTAFELTGPTVVGTCKATGGKAKVPPVVWANAQQGCGPPALPRRDCAVGKLCAPAPPAPFGAQMCIAKRGASLLCPSGAYSVSLDTSTGADDTRGCTACGCGSPLGAGPCGDAFMNTGSSCFGPFRYDAPVPGICTPMGDAGASSYSTYYAPAATVVDAGSCPASGGAPAGAATPSKPVTICCVP